MIPSSDGIGMRILCAFGLAAALMALPATGAERAAPARAAQGPPGCAAASMPDRLREITPEGDLVLASGRLAKLAGIRLPEEPPHREGALSWLRARSGFPVLVQGGEGRDRWDRVSARIRLAGDSPALDLGHGLVEAGLALADPGLADALCQPELLALEETAREQRLGLWADDRYNPIDVNNVRRLQERIGSFVLVEGRVRSVGERAQRTYLNFGEHWAEDFTIIIPQRTWKLMANRGLGAEALKGRRIRARGILQSWQGTALTVVIPEMIERLEDKRLAR